MNITNHSVGHSIAGVIFGVLRAVGSVLGASLAIIIVGYLAYSGVLSSLATLVMGVLIGIPAGVVAALKFLDYAITHQPEVFMNEYKKWKADGRWDSMVAKLNERRATTHN